MIKRTFLTAGLGLSLAVATPAFAQSEGDVAVNDQEVEMAEMEQAMAMLGNLFQVEPLTAEQEARLPLATQIVGKMIPEGSMAEMMGSMFDDMLGPLMDMGGAAGTSTVAENLGVTPFDLDLSDEQTVELANLFDTAWEERQQRTADMFPQLMGEVMSAMEPSMRKAMSELYAINFSDQELTEIDTFFSTETGASFARKSFTMASDPRVMGASMEAMPAIIGMIGSMEERIAESTADLPEARAFGDLSEAEKARITELTGFTPEDIEANLEAAEFAF